VDEDSHNRKGCEKDKEGHEERSEDAAPPSLDKGREAIA
jgi:hypothetical protein